MSWYSSVENNQFEEPRFLTKDEIKYIISKIPSTFLLTEECRIDVKNKHRRYVAQELSKIMVCPDVIEDFINSLIQKHNLSSMIHGSTIGSNLAQEVGRLLTQATLDTFHSAGTAATMTSKLQILKNFLAMNKNPQQFSIIIHFKNKLWSIVDVENELKKIKTIKIKTLIESIDVGLYDNEFWHFFEEDEVLTENRLRIKFDPKKLISNDISLALIKERILEINPVGLKIFFSNTESGIMDIFCETEFVMGAIRELGVDEEVIPTICAEYAIFKIVKSNLREIIVSGFDFLEDVSVLEADIFSFVKSKKKSDNLWSVSFEREAIEKYNVGYKNLHYFFEGIKIRSKFSSSSEAIGYYIENDKNPLELVPDERKSKKYYFVIGIVKGKSSQKYDELLQLFTYRRIDENCSYSDNIHVMLKTFGIDASTRYYMLEAKKRIGVDSPSAEIFAKFLTISGMPKGNSPTSISTRDGYTSVAVVAKPLTIFSKSALAGDQETTQSISTCIILGKKPNKGTGSVVLVQSEGQNIYLNEEIGNIPYEGSTLIEYVPIIFDDEKFDGIDPEKERQAIVSVNSPSVILSSGFDEEDDNGLKPVDIESEDDQKFIVKSDDNEDLFLLQEQLDNLDLNN